jgi:hypothetical protein
MHSRQVNEAWAKWFSEDDWNVYATLNVSRLSALEGNKHDAAAKLWRSCLATVDRAIYGQSRKSQPRFNRVAFRHYGATSTNPHIHILVQSPIDTTEFCIALNAIWASKFAATAAPSSNSIAPLITAKGAACYSLHEDFRQDLGSFDDRLCYINSGIPHRVRDDALQRLHARATEINLIQARLALPTHINTTQANFYRRETRRTAALPRS